MMLHWMNALTRTNHRSCAPGCSSARSPSGWRRGERSGARTVLAREQTVGKVEDPLGAFHPSPLGVHLHDDPALTSSAPGAEAHLDPRSESRLPRCGGGVSLVTLVRPRPRRRSDPLGQLTQVIYDFLQHYNDNPRPFVWTKTAYQVLNKLAHLYANREQLDLIATQYTGEKLENKPDSARKCGSV